MNFGRMDWGTKKVHREKDEWLRKENAKFPFDKMVTIPIVEWPPVVSILKLPPLQVYRSRDFLAQIFSEDGHIRISVNRTRVHTITGNYKDGITWDELQWVKNQCGYASSDCVEVYPKEQDVINVANMRHLWVLSEPLPFIWRNEKK
jgi:hypothetical protein